MTGEQKKTPTLLTLKQASVWASKNLNKVVTLSNISYLIQYGRIETVSNNGITLVSKDSLAAHYAAALKGREATWKKQLGTELNWQLSFEEVKEAETTKHVHRLHPYKGKFIPQLVEYFLTAQRDDAKAEGCFQQGDIVLDPFCGSGTTLIQANELGMHAIGIDISTFNAFMSNAKGTTYDVIELLEESRKITEALKHLVYRTQILDFQAKLVEKLARFNSQFFSASFKRDVKNGEINQKQYGAEKDNVFLKTYHELIVEYDIDLQMPPDSESFLSQWYLPGVKAEIDFVHRLINNVQNTATQNALLLILSRTIRSCRATTHADLGTLREPVTTTYYCRKHGKICKPLFSILQWWERYQILRCPPLALAGGCRHRPIELEQGDILKKEWTF